MKDTKSRLAQVTELLSSQIDALLKEFQIYDILREQIEFTEEGQYINNKAKTSVFSGSTYYDLPHKSYLAGKIEEGITGKRLENIEKLYQIRKNISNRIWDNIKSIPLSKQNEIKVKLNQINSTIEEFARLQLEELESDKFENMAFREEVHNYTKTNSRRKNDRSHSHISDKTKLSFGYEPTGTASKYLSDEQADLFKKIRLLKKLLRNITKRKIFNDENFGNETRKTIERETALFPKVNYFYEYDLMSSIYGKKGHEKKYKRLPTITSGLHPLTKFLEASVNARNPSQSAKKIDATPRIITMSELTGSTYDRYLTIVPDASEVDAFVDNIKQNKRFLPIALKLSNQTSGIIPIIPAHDVRTKDANELKQIIKNEIKKYNYIVLQDSGTMLANTVNELEGLMPYQKRHKAVLPLTQKNLEILKAEQLNNSYVYKENQRTIDRLLGIRNTNDYIATKQS